MQTIVLNADFTYLNTVHWRKGLKLLLKEKAVTVKEADRQIHSVDNKAFNVPLVLRLVELVKVLYKNKVTWSRKKMFERDHYTCQYCDSKGDITIDHVIPVSRGGKTSFVNCVAACKECNLKKGNRTPEEAGMRLKREPFTPHIMDFMRRKAKNSGVYEFLKSLGVYG